MHKKAKKLLSKRELDIMQDKENGGERRIKEKVQLFRKLRNKYRDLAKRQKIATRGVPDASGSSVQNDNSRTLKKMEMFSDALNYFETRLNQIRGPGDKEESEAHPRQFRNAGITPEAIAEKAAHGNDSELECDRQKRQREGDAA